MGPETLEKWLGRYLSPPKCPDLGMAGTPVKAKVEEAMKVAYFGGVHDGVFVGFVVLLAVYVFVKESVKRFHNVVS